LEYSLLRRAARRKASLRAVPIKIAESIEA
jgi:hypothetical protein